VVEGDPLRELLDVAPHALELGVEEVRAVLGRADPVLVDVVVAVAADVAPAVNHERSHPQLLGAPLGQHGAGEPGADDQQVELLVSKARQVASHHLLVRVTVRVRVRMSPRACAVTAVQRLSVLVRAEGARATGARAVAATAAVAMVVEARVAVMVVVARAAVVRAVVARAVVAQWWWLRVMPTPPRRACGSSIGASVVTPPACWRSTPHTSVTLLSAAHSGSARPTPAAEANGPAAMRAQGC
jgi:hypothetical protein